MRLAERERERERERELLGSANRWSECIDVMISSSSYSFRWLRQPAPRCLCDPCSGQFDFSYRTLPFPHRSRVSFDRLFNTHATAARRNSFHANASVVQMMRTNSAAATVCSRARSGYCDCCSLNDRITRSLDDTDEQHETFS